jgi:hypothetical protein
MKQKKFWQKRKTKNKLQINLFFNLTFKFAKIKLVLYGAIPIKAKNLESKI